MKYFFIALIILVILAGVWYISTYNSFIALQNKIEEAFSTMDIYLVKRSDLIPNLVNIVKGYTKHESETLEKIVRARQNSVNAKTNEEKIAAAEELSSAVKGFNVLVEDYPELKADTNFLELQRQLTSIEDDIATSRRYYNGVVRQYNTKVQSFPSSIVANSKGFVRQPLFEVSDDSQRENVKVEF